MLLPPEPHNTSILACYSLNNTSCTVHSPRPLLCKVRVHTSWYVTLFQYTIILPHPDYSVVKIPPVQTLATAITKRRIFSLKRASTPGTPGIVHIPPTEIHDFLYLHRAAITLGTGRLLVCIPGRAPCAGLLSYCHIPTLTLSAQGQQLVSVIITQKTASHLRRSFLSHTISSYVVVLKVNRQNSKKC